MLYGFITFNIENTKYKITKEEIKNTYMRQWNAFINFLIKHSWSNWSNNLDMSALTEIHNKQLTALEKYYMNYIYTIFNIRIWSSSNSSIFSRINCHKSLLAVPLPTEDYFKQKSIIMLKICFHSGGFWVMNFLHNKNNFSAAELVTWL